jgi:haloalkane dehalogenase
VGFKPSPDLYPFESRWLDTPAGRLHYVDEGSGRPLLMVHGNPTWSFLYRNPIRALRERFRCIAVDHLGFGLSERPSGFAERPSGFAYTPAEHARVLRDLVRALDLDDLIVMAHDWGGPIALSAATAEADRVTGLVLGNTWFWPPERHVRMAGRIASSRPLQWASRERNVAVEWLIPAGTARRLTDAEMEHYRAVQPTPAARAGVAAFPRQLVTARPWFEELERSVEHALADKRVLITWPMRDPVFPAKLLPRFTRTFRDARVVELPEAKHFFVEDAPDEVVGAVVERF